LEVFYDIFGFLAPFTETTSVAEHGVILASSIHFCHVAEKRKEKYRVLYRPLITINLQRGTMTHVNDDTNVV
jgi:hypothetical protein